MIDRELLDAIEEGLTADIPAKDWIAKHLLPKAFLQLKREAPPLSKDEIAELKTLAPKKAKTEKAAAGKTPAAKLPGLANIRMARGISQGALAGQIDVHVDTVRNWEAGYCKAAGASIDTICAVLSCTPADLQGTTEV